MSVEEDTSRPAQAQRISLCLSKQLFICDHMESVTNNTNNDLCNN